MHRYYNDVIPPSWRHTPARAFYFRDFYFEGLISGVCDYNSNTWL